MRRRTYIALAAAGGVAGCLGRDDESEASEPDGTDEDDESENEDSEQPPLEQRWREQLATDQANLDYGMAINDGAVFVGHDGGLVALELADGTTRWHRENDSEFTAVHAADDGVVAVADGEVFEVASDSGEIRFRESVEGSLDVLARAGMTANLVLVSTDAGTSIYERDSGEYVTEYDTIQTDIVAGEEVTVLTSPVEAIGIDSETGEQRWRVSSQIGPGGASEDGTLVGVDTGDLETGLVYGYDTADGEKLWEETVTHQSTGFVDVALTDGIAVLVPDRSDESTLHAFDSATGAEQWTADLGQLTNPFGPPAVDDGIVVMETAADIRAFDAETGETLATTDRPFAIRAAVAGDGVFVQWSGEDVVGYDR